VEVTPVQHHRPRHHPPLDPALQVGGVGEDVGELDVVEGPVVGDHQNSRSAINRIHVELSR
jgi:hypothetical protein